MDFTQDTQDAILAAVDQAANGNITKDELLDQLNDMTGGDFRDSPDEDEDGPWVKFEFHIAVDETGCYGGGLDSEQARESLYEEATGDCCDVYKFNGKVAKAKLKALNIGNFAPSTVDQEGAVSALSINKEA